MIPIYENGEEGTSIRGKINRALQSINYEAVENWGVKTTNTAEQNDIAMVDAITAMKSGVGLQFGQGTYRFSASWDEVGTGEFFAIRGVSAMGSSSQPNKTTLLREADVPLINLNGTSVLQGGNDMQQGAIFQNINIHGNDYASDLVRCFSVMYMQWDNVRVYGTTGVGLHLWEAMDSRFYNCVFEWLGSVDGTLAGIRLRSGTFDAGDGHGSVTREYTNQLKFIGCRAEAFRGTIVDTAGDNVNEITFTDCKFEGVGSNQVHFKFINANIISFDNVQSTQLGATGNSINTVYYFDGTDNIRFYGFIESISSSGNYCDLDHYIEINDGYGIDIFLKADSSSNRILDDYLISLTGVSGGTGLNKNIRGIFSVGATKDFIDGSDVKEERFVSIVDQKSENNTEYRMRTYGASNSTNAFWSEKIVNDGTRSKKQSIYWENGTPSICKEETYLGSFVKKPTYFEDITYIPRLTNTPSDNRNGSTYFDDNTDVKALRTRINDTYIRIGRTSSIPSTTTGWSTGDIVYNSAPVAGGYLGWVLTGGVWKGFGLIEA